MKYQDEIFYWSYQCGVSWPDDYLGPDSMTRWIIEKSVGFTARSNIIGNSACSLTAQSAFLNNFENVVNRRVNIQEDIKRYQDTLSYTSSKVDYSVGENIFMLPSDIELRIKTCTVRYNNKILVSDGKFILGKNDEVNSLETPAIKTNSLETPSISHKDSKPTADSETAVTHKDL